MRAVVQRVDKAVVRVGGRQISAIGQGVLVFLGVGKNDDQKDADFLLDKIMHLRIFADQNDKMNLSLRDLDGEMLVVSQFTLLSDCRKGRRPSFVAAEEPQRARMLYEYFLEQAGRRLVRVAGGEFQAMMKIELINDGPVTIILDSK